MCAERTKVPDESDRRSCAVCGDPFPESDLVPLEMVRPSIVELLLAEHPAVPPGSSVCHEDLRRYRSRYIESVLETDRGDLTKLDREVLDSLANQELLSRDLESQWASSRGLGDRVADRVATFGGSWTFILSFFGMLIFWIVINSAFLLRRPFDPYPFIFLNLLLSCLAAIQAPIIMMSQNRQEAKDRARAEHDYRVNLKAELEIRHLHSKMDQLLSHQWRRLLEIQRLQMEMIEEISDRSDRSDRPGPPKAT